ncbi:MAG: response regulator transcription factor [Polyangiaceae bacterium]|nr:response regulator transcription factor [Polyangiaceae bacterium]
MSDQAKKILVIEDDPVGLRMIGDFLTAKGYHVISATNGVDGVEYARMVEPDLVLCDVLLPLKSGFEVCFDLKRPESKVRAPVVLMSAVLQGKRDQGYARDELRADAYLVKPFQMSAMLASIERLLPA